MNATFTLATARRILTQLRHDHRTVAMMVLVPSLLMVLLRYVFNSEQAFSAAAPALLAVFPFAIMFIVTSITTLRERTTATLERLMTMPIGKLDLLFGYAIAFGLVAVLQVLVATGDLARPGSGLEIDGSVWLLLLIAVLDALLGTALGLLASAFARTEFQAVQFMPAIVMPQILLCGLFAPRGLDDAGAGVAVERDAAVLRGRRARTVTHVRMNSTARSSRESCHRRR